MERVKDYGEPHALLLSEDHIVLKLKTPWSRDAPLPEGCSLDDESGSLMVTNHKALVAAKSALCGGIISRALFSGCPAFVSSDRYESAAKEVLKAAEEICIVHNRDAVYKLIRMFPGAKVLALLHDLVTHAVEFEEPLRDRLAPLVESCQLRELVGSLEGLGNDFLMLTEETVRAILITCPLVRRIDSHRVLEAFLRPPGALGFSAYPNARDITRVMLLTSVVTRHARFQHVPGPADITVAARMFPNVEYLMVVLESLQSMAAISAFHHLHTLSVTLRPPICFVDVDLELRSLLKKLPSLEKLSLEFCGGLQLAAIAKLCPKMKRLRLMHCVGSKDDVALEANAFPDMEILEISATILKHVYHGLLMAIAKSLRVLRLYDDNICSEFLHLCCLGGQGISFPHLEELTLETELTVSALELQPEDLHAVVKALPALRNLETDSYDLRLFFENYCVPRGRVCLSWCDCIYCAVHDHIIEQRRKFVTKYVTSQMR